MNALAAPLQTSAPRLQRTEGEARIAVFRRGTGTALEGLYQSGAAKIRLPRSHGRESLEAVLINTSGGLAGGDRIDWRVQVGENASAVITTQACERAYRTLGETARVNVRLNVEAAGRLDWLPQETILYDRSSLTRGLEADVAPGGTLLVVEAVLLGRLAHGETVREALFRDRWRIRRGGKLIFAEETRLDGSVEAVAARAATLSGAAAYASLVLVTDDPAPLLESVRTLLSRSDDVIGGASAFDGKLICRMIGQDGLKLRRTLIPVLAALRGGLGLPRVWAQ